MDQIRESLMDAAMSLLNEGIPTPADNPFANKKKTDDMTSRSPADKANPADTKKSKYSLGAEIKDTTKAVTREETEEVLETIEVEVDGEIIIAEKKKGLDGKACWKGYKQMGTKMKGGKRVDNCVKAGFEPEGEMVEGECSHCGGKGCKKCGGDGKFHDCAKKVKKEGKTYLTVPGCHTMLEDGTVTHYDLLGEGGEFLANVSVEELEILMSEKHEHVVNHNKNGEVLGEKKLDPVNHKELKGDHADRKDKDIDNDGDVDKSDKYLHNRRKKVSAIIGKKKKMKEEEELRREIEEEKK